MNVNQQRYIDLINQAAKIRSYENRQTIENLLYSGAQNADDTILVEKARPVADWDSVFVGSVELLLCSNPYNKTVCKWLANRGITF